MSNKIRHSGIIHSVNNDSLQVRILQTSACAGCKVAGHCSASESKEKMIDVFGNFPESRVGQKVTIVASTQVGIRAVVLGFVVPFVIMVGVLLVLMRLTSSEPLSALLSVVSLIPYYLLLYVCRDRLREKLSFTIENNEIIN